MDEILASIRRIIADDQAQGFAAPSRNTPAQPAPHTGERVEPLPEVRRELRNEVQPEARPEPRRPARPPFEGAPDMRLGEAGRPFRAPKTFADAADLPPPPPPVMREPAARPFQPPRDAVLRGQAVAAETPVPAAPAPRPPRSEGADIAQRLLSPQTDASVSTAFDSLASSAAAQLGHSPSMEDFVREMLQPMLKSWLDENLPNLVERLVRQEIERVARGQR